MKIVFKKTQGFSNGDSAYWVALKDKQGKYHCWVDDSHCSDSIVLAGHIIRGQERESIKKILQKEGHN